MSTYNQPTADFLQHPFTVPTSSHPFPPTVDQSPPTSDQAPPIVDEVPPTLDQVPPTSDQVPPTLEPANEATAAELVLNASYGQFERLVGRGAGVDGGGEGARGGGGGQIARKCSVLPHAVSPSSLPCGMGTAVAMEIKEMSLRYFEDRFADWIVDQGGWVS